MEKTAVTYYRVSLQSMDNDRQISDLREFCKKENYKIIKEYGEKDHGTNDDRIELENMLNCVREIKPDFLILTELSRLTRSIHYFPIMAELNSLGVCVRTIMENQPTLNEDGTINNTTKFTNGVKALVNIYEIENIKDRQKSGLRNSARKGNAQGGNMFALGYQKDYKTKKLILNPDEIETVQLCFNLYKEGKRTNSIANILNDQGKTTRCGKKFYNNTVYKILHNPMYIGQRRFKDELLPFPELRIIEDDLFNEVQLILKQNENKQGIHKKFDYYFDKKLITCGVCGKNYHAEKRTNRRDNRYCCISTSRKGESCGNYSIDIDKLQNQVNNFLLEYFFSYVYRNMNNSTSKNDLKDAENEIIELENELEKEIKKESRLADLLLDKRITDKNYDEKLDRTRKEQVNFKKIIEDKIKFKNELQKMIKSENNFESIEADWKKNGINKDLVLKIISKIVITKDDTIKLCENKQDKVIKVDVYVGSIVGTFWISQRSDLYHVDWDDITDKMLMSSWGVNKIIKHIKPSNE